MDRSPAFLLGLAGAAIGLLVLLVTWRKWNAFIALFLAALVVGVGAGLPPLGVLAYFQEGLGATLGGIAAVIALGAMLGKLLAESGGAESLAEKLNELFGPKRAVLCVVVLATVIGLVTWFAVGLLLLLPLVARIAKRSGQPLMYLAIPMLSVLSTMHGLTPPHPGAVVAINQLNASTGVTLILGLAIGIPTAWIAGPLFAKWGARHALNAESPFLTAPDGNGGLETAATSLQASWLATLGIIALPVGLMLLSTAAVLLLPDAHPARAPIAFIGHPVIALTLAVLLAAWTFGRSCQFDRAKLLSFTEQSVGAIGMTLLVVGAGGGFAKVLREGGVASALGEVATTLNMPLLLYAWCLAVFVRVATGSATVAITTAAGLISPLLASNPEVSRELVVIALGCGSLALSHLNDGGFWIVKDSLGLTVGQTLRTWTVLESIIAVVGLGFTMLLSLIL